MSVCSIDSKISKLSKDTDDRMEALIEACTEGMEKEARRLLLGQGRKLLNEDDSSSGNAPIHAACRGGHLEIVRLLIQRGASPDKVNRCGATPMQMAITGNHLDIVQFLYEELSSGGGGDDDDSTSVREAWKAPLHYAVLFARKRILSWLLDNGADPNQVFDCGRTAVHLICSTIPSSCSAAAVECLETLIEHGADLTVEDKEGRMPIHVANSAGLVSLLLDKLGYDLVNPKDVRGWTPLHHQCASVSAREEVVKYLLDNGADLQAVTNDGDTPLHLAMRHGGLIVPLLLKQDSLDITVKDGLGRNALHLALVYQRNEKYILRFLKESFIPLGGDINDSTNTGWTPLHYTCFYNLFRIQDFLLKQGATMSPLTVAGQTPVHMIGTKNFQITLGGQEEVALQEALNGRIAPKRKSVLRESFSQPLDNEDNYYRIQKASTVPWPAQHDGILNLLELSDCTHRDKEGNLPFFLAASTEWLDASFCMIRMAASQGLFETLGKTNASSSLEDGWLRRPVRSCV